jgi:hypothetical protein
MQVQFLHTLPIFFIVANGGKNLFIMFSQEFIGSFNADFINQREDGKVAVLRFDNKHYYDAACRRFKASQHEAHAMGGMTLLVYYRERIVLRIQGKVNLVSKV